MTSRTAFVGHQKLLSGSPAEVAAALRTLAADAMPLVFDDASGALVDVDPNGLLAEAPPPQGRGRPRLGVVAREVTLLPRHWDWLAAQPGGASVTLRRLVDAARRDDSGDGGGDARAAREASYRFLAAIAGDLPGYEEALRALFAGDAPGFAGRLADWPEDVRGYALRLARAGLA